MMTCSHGWTWGGVAHWAAARLANDALSPATSKQIKQILSSDETLMSVSTIPDSWRYQPAWKHTYDYHFDTVSANVSYLDQLKTLDSTNVSKGGATQSVLQALKILKNRKFNSNTASVRVALIFLVHFVGDLHQPLHIGVPGDKGGNAVLVNWMGKETNLHAIWDSEMIMTHHADILSGSEIIQNSKIYAQYLKKTFHNAMEPDHALRSMAPQLIFSDDEVQDWVNEGIELRDQLYVGYDQNQKQYQEQFGVAQDFRVYLAGQRLGRILNGLFDSAYDLAIEGRFRKLIEQIVGKIDQIIKLTPQSQQAKALYDLDNSYAKN